MKTYIAIVKLLIPADSEAEACDAISAMLSENLQQSNAIIDWAYVNSESPKPHKEIELSSYEEGEFIHDLGERVPNY